MIRVPGNVAAASRGKTTRALVELVDMYKTLADLFGLRTETGVEGRSFAPLLRDPQLSHSVRFQQPISPRSIMIVQTVLLPGPHLRDNYGCLSDSHSV